MDSDTSGWNRIAKKNGPDSLKAKGPMRQKEINACV